MSGLLERLERAGLTPQQIGKLLDRYPIPAVGARRRAVIQQIGRAAAKMVRK